MNAYRLLITFLALFIFAGCSVEQTEEGEMPEVHVEEGNMPEYDVDAVDVDVGTQEKTITVPDVDVTMPGDADYDDDDR